jgi:hypothetical protein
MLRRLALQSSLRCQPARSIFSSAQRSAAAVAADATEESDADRELREHLAELTEHYEDTPQHGTVLYNWGMYPFYGLLGTTIISKELVVIDHNYPSLIMFSTAFLAATWIAGPSMHKTVGKAVMDQQQDYHDTFKLIFALLDKRSTQIEANNKQPELLKTFAEEYKATAAAAAEAEVRALQYTAYNETVAKLEAIANQKQAEVSAQANVAFDIMSDFLYSQFDDKQIISKTVDEAIENLGKDMTEQEASNSIVRGMLTEFIESGDFDFQRRLAADPRFAEDQKE